MTIKAIDLGDMVSGEIDTMEDSVPTKDNLSLLNDIDVSLDVRIGTTLVSVNQLFSLKKGDTLKLEQLVNEPVELIFNDKIIGKGELVAAGEYFGVKVTEID
jgi:flagellar motor switch protein FliN/FliY